MKAIVASSGIYNPVKLQKEYYSKICTQLTSAFWNAAFTLVKLVSCPNDTDNEERTVRARVTDESNMVRAVRGLWLCAASGENIYMRNVSPDYQNPDEITCYGTHE